MRIQLDQRLVMNHYRAGEFARQRQHKAEWYGSTLIKVDRFYPSSNTCSACGHRLQALPLAVRQW